MGVVKKWLSQDCVQHQTKITASGQSRIVAIPWMKTALYIHMERRFCDRPPGDIVTKVIFSNDFPKFFISERSEAVVTRWI